MEEPTPSPPENHPPSVLEPVPTVQPKTAPPLRKFSFNKFNQRLTLAISILLKLGGILLAILLIVLFWHEITYKGYSLTEVYVPSEFDKNGYTGAVLAAKVESRLLEVKTMIGRQRDPLGLGVKMNDIDIAEYALQAKGSELELNMVGVGLPVRSFINFIGKSLEISPSKDVALYVTTSGPNCILQLGFSGKLFNGIRVRSDSLGMDETVNELVRHATESILRISNRELLIQYLLLSGQESEKIIQLCKETVLSQEDTVRNKFVYYTWGWTLVREKRYAEAIAKFRRSNNIDPNWIGPYLAIQEFLIRTGEFSEAKRMAERAMKLAHTKRYDENNMDPVHFMMVQSMYGYYSHMKNNDSTIYYAREYMINRRSKPNPAQVSDGYNTMADAFSRAGQYDSAIWYSGQSIRADSSQAVNYITMAEIYGFQMNDQEFFSYLEKGLKSGYPSRQIFSTDTLAPYSSFRDDKRFKELLKRYP